MFLADHSEWQSIPCQGTLRYSNCSMNRRMERKAVSSWRQIHGGSMSRWTRSRVLCRWKRSQKTRQTPTTMVSRRFNQHVRRRLLPPHGRTAESSNRDTRVASHQTFNSTTIGKYFWNRTAARHRVELRPCADVRIIDPFPFRRRNKPILRNENPSRTTFAPADFAKHFSYLRNFFFFLSFSKGDCLEKMNLVLLLALHLYERLSVIQDSTE